ncbi:MAG: efflux RND transporter periplasmic adaptor subunit [Verrucomicrobia bacterium]|nr:efflux RND transporter periplasmic adaptor subunit [Verrucomicrobiota bacterium]
MSVQITNLKTKSAPPSPPKRSRFLRVLIWIVVLGLFALGFYLVSMPKPAPKGRALGTVTITTATAAKGNIGDYLDAIGTVTPVYTASIFSQVTGVVTKVNYQEGQIVKEGDPLVDIDDRQYQAQLVQAQGALQRDQNVLAQAQMDLQRYRDAWARNGVAKQTLDDQEKLVLQEQGTVKNDEGAVQFDQLQVEYCHIKAPIAGRVGLRPIDPGNLVTAGTSSSSSSATPLVVITQIQPITVVFTIAEDNLGAVMDQLRSGAKLTVDVFDRAAKKKLATGELIAVDNQIDTTTGTAKVRASFPNDDFALFPNQFVNTRLLVQTLQDVTLIPSSTIQQNGQTSFVYVIQDNAAHLKNIKPGVSDNGLTQVEGINPGDVLADSSFDKLQDNTKITVATGKPAATEAPGGQQKHGNQHKQGNEKPGSDQQSASKGT